MLKQGVGAAPSLTRAIDVMLDITHKKHMEKELFARLKMAYLLNLKKTLEGEKDVTGSVVKDLKLYLVYKEFVFSLDVEPPLKQDEETSSSPVANPDNVQNFLQGLGLRFHAWPGTVTVVKRWVSAKMLDSVIDPVLVELFVADLFMNPLSGLEAPVGTIGAGAVPMIVSEPASLVLRAAANKRRGISSAPATMPPDWYPRFPPPRMVVL